MRFLAPLALATVSACVAAPDAAHSDLDGIVDELRRISDEAPGLALPDPLGRRIVALSRSLQPGHGEALSRGRGELLRALLAAELDVSAVVADCDFSSADLRGVALAGRDLLDRLANKTFSEAYLDEDYLKGRRVFSALLRGINLRGADLSGADLHGAELSDALLRDAVLVDTDLRRAVLNRADLRGADLRGADLTRASLFEADLRGAKLGGAKLDGANLRGARRCAGEGRE